MFTGLVEALGTVESVVEEASGKRFVLAWPDLPEPMTLGESVAVNGCCLTVVSAEGDRFTVQAGPETLLRTNLGTKKTADRVNFERSLRVGDRLGGHFVQGHIDTTAELTARRPEGEWEFLRFSLDPEWLPLLVPKGSIAIDGVSLTLVDVDAEGFSIMLIPHTLAVTTLGALKPGDRVNIETDMLAKHVRKLLPEGGRMATGCDLHDRVDAVHDEESFLGFLGELARDWEQERKIESQHPSPPYGPGALGWENSSIGSFIDAAISWAEASKNGMKFDSKPANPWRRAAQILHAGKFYE